MGCAWSAVGLKVTEGIDHQSSRLRIMKEWWILKNIRNKLLLFVDSVAERRKEQKAMKDAFIAHMLWIDYIILD